MSILKSTNVFGCTILWTVTDRTPGNEIPFCCCHELQNPCSAYISVVTNKRTVSNIIPEKKDNKLLYFHRILYLRQPIISPIINFIII